MENRFFKVDIQKAKGYIAGKEVIDQLKNRFFCVLHVKEIQGMFFIKLGRIYAVLIDRIIFDKEFEFFVKDKDKFFECLQEVDYKTVKESVDNTQALLSKKIFRR